MVYFVIMDATTVTVKEATFVSTPHASQTAAEAQAAVLRSILPPTLPIATSEPRKRRRRRVIRLADNVVFDSVAEAARAIGCAPTAIFRHLRDPVRHWNAKGYTFNWYQETRQ